MKRKRQTELPFPPHNETREQRIERIFNTSLKDHLRPTSELTFAEAAFRRATQIAQRANQQEK